MSSGMKVSESLSPNYSLYVPTENVKWRPRATNKDTRGPLDMLRARIWLSLVPVLKKGGMMLQLTITQVLKRSNMLERRFGRCLLFFAINTYVLKADS